MSAFLIPSFVIGKCVHDKVVKEVHYENNSLTLNYNDITSFLVRSQPTLKSNLAFKDTIVKDHYIFNTSVKSTDVESLFIKPRHFASAAEGPGDSSYPPSYNSSALVPVEKGFEADKTKKTFSQD